MQDLAAQQRRGRAFIVLAALAWSTAGVFQRALDIGTVTQIAGRAFFAVFALFLFVAIAERGRPLGAFRTMGRGGVAVAVLLAVASVTFIAALNHATVANVLFMQALAPLFAAALGMVVMRERVTSRTWTAMVVALAGVALMVGGPGRPSLLGASLSFSMTLAFAATLVVTRHRRDVSMAPAMCLSQVLVVVVAGPFSRPGDVGGDDLVVLVILGFCQIGLGLLFLTIGARLIPIAEVALISLLEIVLAPIWVWLTFSEEPSAASLAGGCIVLGAVAMQARSDAPRDDWVPPP